MSLKRPLPASRYYLVLPAFLIILVGLMLAANQAGAAEWRAAVDPALLAMAEQPGPLEFIVQLEEQADLSPASQLPSKGARGAFVFQRLRETAARSQRGLLAELAARGASTQSFWIVNAILVRADADTLRELAVRPEVRHIFANPQVSFSAPVPEPAPAAAQSAAGIEWNLQLIGAPQLWAMGFNGQGVVVGGQDTGYDWLHPALKNQYRGWDGSAADHDYNWHDAIHSSSGTCGFDSPFPCDDHGHGTHTMGIMVGDDGGSNQIGVAPGARWIGCRNMDHGVGTPATYIECFQWFVAPTEISGDNPDPSKAPDIINNSWSCPVSEGCDDPDILRQAVENVRAAGILTVQAAGNSGPLCGTINTPAAIYDASFTAGATTAADQIASYSSRGPVTIDGSQRQKPDIVAPGSGVRSSHLGGGYLSLSGTSMAAPHVAGLAALLMSANGQLSGDVDRLEQVITESAKPLFSTQDCGAIPGDQIPNAVFGYGRIDAVAAIRLVLDQHAWLPMAFQQAAFDLGRTRPR